MNNRPIVKIRRATMYPNPTEPPHEIPGAQVVGIAGNAGLFTVTERLPDGRQALWVNVPCRIEHEEPSGLVAGGGIFKGAQ